MLTGATLFFVLFLNPFFFGSNVSRTNDTYHKQVTILIEELVNKGFVCWWRLRFPRGGRVLFGSPSRAHPIVWIGGFVVWVRWALFYIVWVGLGYVPYGVYLARVWVGGFLPEDDGRQRRAVRWLERRSEVFWGVLCRRFVGTVAERPTTMSTIMMKRILGVCAARSSQAAIDDV